MADVKAALDESLKVQYVAKQNLAGVMENGHLLAIDRAGYWFPQEMAKTLGDNWQDFSVREHISYLEWASRYLDTKSRETGIMCKIVAISDEESLRLVLWCGRGRVAARSRT